MKTQLTSLNQDALFSFTLCTPAMPRKQKRNGAFNDCTAAVKQAALTKKLSAPRVAKNLRVVN